jgi:hypothetical protein
VTDLDTDKEVGEGNDQEILDEATERFARVKEDDQLNRDNYLDDYHFVYSPGRQWAEEIRTQRQKWKEPCLEFNQLKQFVNQVVNDQRQNKPAIIVHPAGGDASKEVAEIEQGLIRAIEQDPKSPAEIAYDTGFQAAVVGGRGWWRICAEYDGKSFNQKICIKPIQDALTVYGDLDYQEPDGSDRNYVFVVEQVHKDDFVRRWPKATPVSWDDLDSNWKEGKDILLVADYYRRVPKKRVLVMNSDGAVGFEDEMPPRPSHITEVHRREVETYEVEWLKIAGGAQILERYECAGEVIPVIHTCGDDILIQGKRIYQGLIRQARDAQAMLNFGMTQQAIHLALTPKAPYIAPQEAIQDYQNIWKNANTENYSVLPYKHNDSNGNPIPMPQRVQPSTPDSGWRDWTQQMMAGMRSIIGMYEASLGMKGNEVSGRAIAARQKEGDVGTYHFMDNFHRAIALTGRIIQSWIPVYYDTERIVHIIGNDGMRKIVTLNQQAPHPDDPTKQILLNDVSVGDYAVVIDAGPGYMTKRQETAEKLTQMVQAFPPLMQAAGDLVVKAQDIQDADLIAERLEMMLPPPVQQMIAAKKEGGKPDPVTVGKLMQAQQQMQQMQQALQELQQENVKLKSGAQADAAKIQLKAQESQHEAMLRQQEQQAMLQMQREKAMQELELKKQIAEQEAQIEIYKAQLNASVKLQVTEMEQQTQLQTTQVSAANAAVESTPEPTEQAPQVPQQIHIHNGGGTKMITFPDGRQAKIETVE